MYKKSTIVWTFYKWKEGNIYNNKRGIQLDAETTIINSEDWTSKKF